jgi:hypothetical protein
MNQETFMHDLSIEELKALTKVERYTLISELAKFRPVKYVAVRFQDELGTHYLLSYEARSIDSGPMQERFTSAELLKILNHN